jgi:two-component system OmpR family sensor kinase
MADAGRHAGAPAVEVEVAPGRQRPLLSSMRARILCWYVVLLVLALAIAVSGSRHVQLTRLDDRLGRELAGQVQHLRVLANTPADPVTGRPWGSVQQLFYAQLARTAPQRNLTMLSFVDGRPFLRSAEEPPARIDTDPHLTVLWGSLAVPRTGMVPSAAGEVIYAAVPVRVVGDPAHGVFVAAAFRDRARRGIDEMTRLTVEAGLAALVVGSMLAWVAAGRVLAPVRMVADMARTISDGGLSARIQVRGRDEASQLTATFNGMLDRLESSFAAQRNFIDDAGHELRTPITIIRGHLELLGDDPAERRETIAIVTDELDRMTRMVDELLVLARAEQPDFLDLELVDVETLTSDLLAKARVLARRDWRLERTGLGLIVADRQRLTQAVMQLAQNATQHTTEGARIMLGSGINQRVARFWIRDTGPGVASADRARIFARFGRGSTGRRRSDGAGLGLAIVDAIAHAHHGHVELESSSGAGATFTLVVPVEPPGP